MASSAVLEQAGNSMEPVAVPAAVPSELWSVDLIVARSTAVLPFAASLASQVRA